MASVRLQQVIKTYPGAEVPAVQRIDLDIPDGELFVLLGPSGCGKSTLLKLIAGIEEPSDGAVWIGDRVVNYMPSGQRDVAMVFQNYALYPHMTVDQNVRFPLRMQKTRRPEADAAVGRVTRLLGLEELVRRPVSQLSGGQKQRVAVARALVREPAVLLMDEPLSNLDALLRAQLREELIALHDQVGGTMVYVTHDQVEAMTMADRIGVMHAGEMVQLGTPTEIYRRPANRFVAGFIGSPPMNFVEGELGRDGASRFVADGLALDVPDRLAARLAPGSATLGVRPEDVQVNVDGARESAAAWTIHIVENLGREQIVSMRRGDATMRARVAPDLVLDRGAAVIPLVESRHVHLFDSDGRNVGLAESSGSLSGEPATASA